MDKQLHQDNFKAERDALRAKRAEEHLERNLRKKEWEAECLKKEQMEKLNKGRAKQVEYKHHLLSVQGKRDKSDFDRILKYVCVLILRDELYI